MSDKYKRELDQSSVLQQIQHCLAQGGGVCTGVQVPTLCSVLKTPDCLVDFKYPPTPNAIQLTTAEKQEIQAEVAEQTEERRARIEQIHRERQLHIRPDWRFWLGITLAGAGLFLYRNPQLRRKFW